MMNRLPPGWTTATVGDACSIRNELRLPISREERRRMPGPYPYYGPTGRLDNIASYRLDGTFAFIGEDGDHFLDVIQKPQTILVSGKLNVNNHAHVIDSTPKCCAEWFFNYFRHRNLTPYLTRQGAGRYKLNKKALQALQIVLPPLAEQRAIEDTMSLIAWKEQRHRWLLQRLIDQKAARLHWTTQEIGSVIRERKERAAQIHDIPVLTSSRRGLCLQSQYFSRQVASNNLSAYKIMRRGDLTFRSMSDDGRFVFNRLEEPEAGLISPAYGVFVAESAWPEFLAHYLNSAYFAQLLTRETQGGTRKSLRLSALARIEVDLPTLGEQKRIAAVLDVSRREIDMLREDADCFRRQQRGIMQWLLSGKRRLTVPPGVGVKESA